MPYFMRDDALQLVAVKLFQQSRSYGYCCLIGVAPVAKAFRAGSLMM